MSRRDDQDHVVLGDGLGRKKRIVDFALYDADIGLAVADERRRIVGVGDLEADLDAWIGAPKVVDQRREPISRDRLARGERQASALEAGEICQRLLCGRGAGEHAARLAEKHSSCFRQHDAAPDAVEKFCGVTCLQRRHRGANGRLREVQILCGLRHMLAFGDSDEDAELLERHRFATSRVTRRGPCRQPLRSGAVGRGRPWPRPRNRSRGRAR